MNALILEGQVVQITGTTFEVHNSMEWVVCGDDITTEHTYNGTEFIKAIPVELTYDVLRVRAYNALNQLELISDDSINGTTTHKDAILAIKAEFPKP